MLFYHKYLITDTFPGKQNYYIKEVELFMYVHVLHPCSTLLLIIVINIYQDHNAIYQ